MVLWVIAFSSQDTSIISLKVYTRKSQTIYQTFGTVTIPAAETKSIGLPADAQLAADDSALMITSQKINHFLQV